METWTPALFPSLLSEPLLKQKLQVSSVCLFLLRFSALVFSHFGLPLLSPLPRVWDICCMVLCQNRGTELPALRDCSARTLLKKNSLALVRTLTEKGSTLVVHLLGLRLICWFVNFDPVNNSGQQDWRTAWIWNAKPKWMETVSVHLR